MVQHDIEFLNNRYAELRSTLISAAYTLLDLDPVVWRIDVDIHAHRAFDIEFKVHPDGMEDQVEIKTIPPDVIDKLYESNLDAAMKRWDEINMRNAESKRISDEIHQVLDTYG